jgi:hypothetical protein
VLPFKSPSVGDGTSIGPCGLAINKADEQSLERRTLARESERAHF